MGRSKSSELEIVNPLGLHARAAAKLVGLANKYESEIWIAKDGQEVNGKSILGVLMLACGQGSKISLRVEGRDADKAHSALSELVGDGFGEM
ncbi:Phosphocarrier protein HPr [Enhygromyxa salina]|uniref:Phosphocarrier protein HPr n=1 Tax=Enhygromyxa salina TaxID=215803 RepID=A0A2S9YDU1_9BACT|nr:HPr family phosphocarrier protein [Enhygromyxa salina]PRQ03265.1 Phosphocarrier protein HPr [Enhygromyxa salina]